MGKEKWKQIGGCFVSTYGNVKALNGRPLKGHKSRSGHIIVHLADKHINVGKLVADAFLEGTGKVYHIDGDLTNNKLENLERR